VVGTASFGAASQLDVLREMKGEKGVERVVRMRGASFGAWAAALRVSVRWVQRASERLRAQQQRSFASAFGAVALRGSGTSGSALGARTVRPVDALDVMTFRSVSRWTMNLLSENPRAGLARSRVEEECDGNGGCVVEFRTSL